MRRIIIALVSLMVASAAASAQNENKTNTNVGIFFLQLCENADSPDVGVMFVVAVTISTAGFCSRKRPDKIGASTSPVSSIIRDIVMACISAIVVPYRCCLP